LPSEECPWCSDSPDGIEPCPDCDRRAEEEGMAEMRAEEKERLREWGMD
jgi:hypothetical protein